MSLTTEAGERAPGDKSSVAGRVEAIWLKRAHRGPMDVVSRATLVEGQGVAGSVGRSKRRQVTLIAREAWDQCMTDLQTAADPKGRRANILLRGIKLVQTRGRVLVVGTTRLAIGGELTPCERMEDVVPGLQAVMRSEWRGGVFAQVLTGGEIAVGDLVQWE